MGTGCRTGLPMILADELEADWNRVRVVQAVGDAKYGSQNTDGSCSVRDFYDAMRNAGATARTALEQAAARKWGVPADECQGRNHFVTHTKSARKLSYGELVPLASAARAAGPGRHPASRRRTSFRYIGKDIPIVDLGDIVAGRAVFGIDARMNGMLYAAIERPPFIGSAMKSCDDSAARQVKGVRQVAQLDLAQPPYGFKALGGVAVLADNTWSAIQGRKRLKVDWDAGANASYDSDAYRARMLDTVRKPGRVARGSGRRGRGVRQKRQNPRSLLLHARCWPHAPMEPPAAVAEFRNGKVETWAATQNPQEVQNTVAKALGISKDGRAVPRHAARRRLRTQIQARLRGRSRAALPADRQAHQDRVDARGRHPLRLLPLPGGHVRQGRVGRARDAHGLAPPLRVSAHRIAERSQRGIRRRTARHGLDRHSLPHPQPARGKTDPRTRTSASGGCGSGLEHLSRVRRPSPSRTNWPRRPAATGWNTCFQLLGEPRVIDLAKEGAPGARGNPKYPFDTRAAAQRDRAGGAKVQLGQPQAPPPAGRSAFAAHRSFLTYVAAAVEVEMGPGNSIRIPRIDIALDAGRVINPDRVRSQFEGAAVFGTSIALMSEITVSGGRFQQTNFDGYNVARMDEARAGKPTYTSSRATRLRRAVGEPGVPPIAPAICNAIFAATGKRIRELPVRKQL